MQIRYRPRRRGATLTEVVMATAIIGIVMVGAMSVVGASLRTRLTAADQNTGARLAEELLSEIMSAEYEDPTDSGGWGAGTGPETGESTATRADFDDVDDYKNWNETTVQDKSGTSLPEFTGWSRTVSVNWGNQLTGDIWPLWETGLKRIQVDVTSPSGEVTTRFGYRHKWGSLEQPGQVSQTVVTMISGELELGASGATTRASSNTFNHAADPNTP